MTQLWDRGKFTIATGIIAGMGTNLLFSCGYIKKLGDTVIMLMAVKVFTVIMLVMPQCQFVK